MFGEIALHPDERCLRFAEEAIELSHAPQGAIAKQFGVTKCVIAGMAFRQKWAGRYFANAQRGHLIEGEPETLLHRMQVLADTMEAVLRDTREAIAHRITVPASAVLERMGR